MFVVDILLAFLGLTLVIAMWLGLFFMFDSEVLNGYFKRKLQKRFPVEE